MKKVLLSVVLSIAGACCCQAADVMEVRPLAHGPKLTAEEFFARRLTAEAREKYPDAHAFAAFVRKHLAALPLNDEWRGRQYSKKDTERLTKAAARTMAGELCSCSTWHKFPGGEVDWFANPTWNKYREWTWQLSRHPFLTTLAEYYTLTRDPKAAAAYVRLLGSWFDQAQAPDERERDGATLCWRTIEAGIRMSGWSRQIAAFAADPILSDDFMVAYFRSICEHGDRLRRSKTGGNWHIMEMNGLLRISLLYPFLADSAAWRQYALDQLKAEFGKQVYDDGFQVELTTGYHGVVVGNYLAVIELYRLLKLEPPEFLAKGLENMFMLYAKLSRPDRRTPDVNDGSHADVCKMLERGFALFPERHDFEWFATGGKRGTPPDFTSIALPNSGAAVFRDGWDRKGVWAYLDGGPYGQAHQHEDALNFLLFAYGKEMLTEGGCYAYDTSPMRRYVLSTRAHNTARINGLDQDRRNCGKSWRNPPLDMKWPGFTFEKGVDGVVTASGVYDDGYSAGKGKKRDLTRHCRTVRFEGALSSKPRFVVTDEFTAPDDQERTWELMWHLEKCELANTDTGFKADFGDGVWLVCECAGENWKDMQGTLEPELQGFMPVHASFAGGDHPHRPIHTPVFAGRFKGSKRVVTVFCPVQDVKR